MQTIKLNEILLTKKAVETPIDEMAVIKQMTKKIISKLTSYIGLTKKELIAILPVSDKTIERLKDNQIIDLVLAEHLLHLAKVTKEGIDVFEDPKVLGNWLKTPHPLISGLEPYEVLRTVTGCNILIDILGRAKYGIYS